MVKGVVIDGKRIDKNRAKSKSSKPVAKRNLSRKEMLSKKGGDKAKKNDKKKEMVKKKREKEREERRKRFMPQAAEADKPKQRKNSDGRIINYTLDITMFFYELIITI